MAGAVPRPHSLPHCPDRLAWSDYSLCHCSQPSPGRIFPNCILLIGMPFPPANQRATGTRVVITGVWEAAAATVLVRSELSTAWLARSAVRHGTARLEGLFFRFDGAAGLLETPLPPYSPDSPPPPRQRRQSTVRQRQCVTEQLNSSYRPSNAGIDESQIGYFNRSISNPYTLFVVGESPLRSAKRPRRILKIKEFFGT